MNKEIYYYNNTVKHDLINKFYYKNLSELPKFKKIILTFNNLNANFKHIILSLMALELLTLKKGIFIYSQQSNVFLKLRKGYPIGCTIILKNFDMYDFIFKLLLNYFNNIKNIKMNKKNKKMFSFKLKNLLIFPEFEQNYYYFKNLSNLNITFVITKNNYKELKFLLQSFKIIL